MKYYGFKSVAKFPRSNLKNLGFAANGMAQVIKSLFANNEQGFAFDFNDLSTMYQDSAGTIPVTGVEQPVGLVLDKSKPILSNNISILDSNFLTVNDWVISNAGISITEVNNTLRIAKGAITPQHIYKVFNCEANVLYRLTIKYKNHTGNNVRAFIRNTIGAGLNNTLFQPLQTFTSVEGELTSLFISSSNGHSIYIDSQNAADSSIDITQISIVKVSNSANHASQSTSSKRPLLKSSPMQLKYDGIDDVMTVNLPAQLTGCTLIRAIPNVGTQILSNQTISALYSDSTTNSGLIVVNRALTSEETTRVTQVFNKLAGV